LRRRFCGVHFFNPPRYMHLVELIPTAGTDGAILDRLETFLTTTWARAWCAPRTHRTLSPTAWACSPFWR
jgi:3-hydroxyacyl-CoA dehydrogenase (EC 1.1.1.35)